MRRILILMILSILFIGCQKVDPPKHTLTTDSFKGKLKRAYWHWHPHFDKYCVRFITYTDDTMAYTKAGRYCCKSRNPNCSPFLSWFQKRLCWATGCNVHFEGKYDKKGLFHLYFPLNPERDMVELSGKISDFYKANYPNKRCLNMDVCLNPDCKDTIIAQTCCSRYDEACEPRIDRAYTWASKIQNYESYAHFFGWRGQQFFNVEFSSMFVCNQL